LIDEFVAADFSVVELPDSLAEFIELDIDIRQLEHAVLQPFAMANS
jgi:hypothetical protein